MKPYSAFKKSRLYSFFIGCLEKRAKERPLSTSRFIDTILNSQVNYSEENIAKIINAIPPDDVPVAMCLAIFFNDQHIMALIEQHHPLHVNVPLEVSSKASIIEIINSDLRGALTFCNGFEPHQIRQTIDSLTARGYGWLLGIGHNQAPLLDYANQRSRFLISRSSPHFNGPLPVLSVMCDTVEHPELILAQNEHRLSAVFPQTFRFVLCLVPTESIKSMPFPFHAFDSRRFFNFYDNDKGVSFSESVTDSSALELIIQSKNRPEIHCPYRFTSINMDLNLVLQASNAFDISVLKAHETYLQGALIPRSLQLGLPVAGYTLCMLDIDDVLGLNVGPFEERLMEQAREHLNRYYPLDLVCSYGFQAFDAKNRRHFSRPSAPGISSTKQILEELADPDLADGIKHAFSKAVWKEIAMKERYISGLQAAALKNHLGFDTAQWRVEIDPSEMNSLVKMGFQFDAGSRGEIHPERMTSSKKVAVLYRNDPEDMSQTEYRKAVYQLIDMGVVLDPQVQGRSISEVLKIAAKRPKLSSASTIVDAALTKSMLMAGPGACAEAAVSPGQWNALMKIFSGAEMGDHLHHAPAAVQRRFLSNDLGL